MSTPKATPKATLLDVLSDLETRFLLPLPYEELSSPPRLFFQLEQAYWFYLDFHLEEQEDLPKYKNLEIFSKKMFGFSELLMHMQGKFKEVRRFYLGIYSTKSPITFPSVDIC